jgi:hypothetical protein
LIGVKEDKVGKIGSQNREGLFCDETSLLFMPLSHLLASQIGALPDLFHSFGHAILFLL